MNRFLIALAFVAGCLVASNAEAHCGVARRVATAPARLVTAVVDAQPVRTTVRGVVTARPVATVLNRTSRVVRGVTARVFLR